MLVFVGLVVCLHKINHQNQSWDYPQQFGAIGLAEFHPTMLCTVSVLPMCNSTLLVASRTGQRAICHAITDMKYVFEVFSTSIFFNLLLILA